MGVMGMDFTVIAIEMAVASVIVTLACKIWDKYSIYKLPVKGMLFHPTMKEAKMFRSPAHMVRLIQELLTEQEKKDADLFNLAGMFIFPKDFLMVGGILKQDYLDGLADLLRAEGLVLSQPEKPLTEKNKRPLWVRPEALDYYLSVISSQTTGITKEMREGACRFMYVWMRCALQGFKTEVGKSYDYKNTEHRRWVVKRMIHYAAFLLDREGKSHGLLDVDAVTIPDRYLEFDALDFTEEESAMASTIVFLPDAPINKLLLDN